MTMTDTGVKPIPAYVPPEDGPPLHGTQGKGPEGNHRWV